MNTRHEGFETYLITSQSYLSSCLLKHPPNPPLSWLHQLLIGHTTSEYQILPSASLFFLSGQILCYFRNLEHVNPPSSFTPSSAFIASLIFAELSKRFVHTHPELSRKSIHILCLNNHPPHPQTHTHTSASPRTRGPDSPSHLFLPNTPSPSLSACPICAP